MNEVTVPALIAKPANTLERRDVVWGHAFVEGWKLTMKPYVVDYHTTSYGITTVFQLDAKRKKEYTPDLLILVELRE
jgi:hypothetical protein